MARGYYRKVVKRIRGAGYAYERNCDGSHEKWVHPETGVILIIPYNLYGRGLAIKILKDAGVNPRI